MAPRIRAALTALAVAAAIVVPRAQSPALDRELRRIFQSNDYVADTFGPSVWLEGGRSYGVIERSSDGAARILVAYDTATGRREVLADAALLTPSGADRPARGRQLCVVARSTAGAAVHQHQESLAGEHPRRLLAARPRRAVAPQARRQRSESSLMFAKFSPDGSSAAYVRDRNLYVEPLNGGAIRQLTNDGSPTIVNGTSDWVSEEELGIRDAFRWSPDGTVDRLLAVRRIRRRAVHLDQRHRQPLPDGHPDSVSEGRHHELRRAHRRRRRRRRRDPMDEDSRRSAQHLSDVAAVDRRLARAADPAVEPPAEHQRSADRRPAAPARCGAPHGEHGTRLGGDGRRPGLARRWTRGDLDEREGRLASSLPRRARRFRRSTADQVRGGRRRRRVG